MDFSSIQMSEPYSISDSSFEVVPCTSEIEFDTTSWEIELETLTPDIRCKKCLLQLTKNKRRYSDRVLEGQLYNCQHYHVEMVKQEDHISEVTWDKLRPDWFNNVEKRDDGNKRKSDDKTNGGTKKKLKLEVHQASTSRLQEDTDEPIASTSERIIEQETMAYLRNTLNFTILQSFLLEMAAKEFDSVMSLNE